MRHIRKDYPHTGTLRLYRGTELLRQAIYTDKPRRVTLQQIWLTEIKNLKNIEPFYFTIQPD